MERVSAGRWRTVIIEPTYYRAHGLGNDYLVFQAAPPEASAEEGWFLSGEAVQRICHRWEGVGSDGVVVLLEAAPEDGVFPLRMFNPDGSEFERSGNGLRVLGAHLHSAGLVEAAPFQVRSGGSLIGMQVHGRTPTGILDLSVQMGRARVGPTAVDLKVPGGRVEPGEAPVHLDHPSLGAVAFLPVSVGNPHAVVFTEDLSPGNLEALGPFLATHPAFARGTNVQLARVEAWEGEGATPATTSVGGGEEDRVPGPPQRLRIAIWERGVGRTSASGTSSCAASVAAVATGRLEPGPITVEMDGGEMEVTVATDLEVTLRGPVREVCRGRLLPGFLAFLRS
jgi:diaminopimelate epimerase